MVMRFAIPNICVCSQLRILYRRFNQQLTYRDMPMFTSNKRSNKIPKQTGRQNWRLLTKGSTVKTYHNLWSGLLWKIMGSWCFLITLRGMLLRKLPIYRRMRISCLKLVTLMVCSALGLLCVWRESNDSELTLHSLLYLSFDRKFMHTFCLCLPFDEVWDFIFASSLFAEDGAIYKRRKHNLSYSVANYYYVR